jgi:hypothetical protein
MPPSACSFWIVRCEPNVRERVALVRIFSVSNETGCHGIARNGDGCRAGDHNVIDNVDRRTVRVDDRRSENIYTRLKGRGNGHESACSVPNPILSEITDHQETIARYVGKRHSTVRALYDRAFEIVCPDQTGKNQTRERGDKSGKQSFHKTWDLIRKAKSDWCVKVITRSASSFKYRSRSPI